MYQDCGRYAPTDGSKGSQKLLPVSTQEITVEQGQLSRAWPGWVVDAVVAVLEQRSQVRDVRPAAAAATRSAAGDATCKATTVPMKGQRPQRQQPQR